MCSGGACTDENESCSKWADKGYCTSEFKVNEEKRGKKHKVNKLKRGKKHKVNKLKRGTKYKVNKVKRGQGVWSITLPKGASIEKPGVN